MKSMGRRHRPFFRICAMDSRTARDGRTIEELGHYDPMCPNAETQTVLNVDRIRYWAAGRHRQVDDRPFGGGPGMVLMAPPVVAAVEAVQACVEPPGLLIALSPQGPRLTQDRVLALAAQPRLILLCGRYEGFDER